MIQRLSIALSSVLLIVSFWIATNPCLHGQTLPVEVISWADTIFYNGQILTMDSEQLPVHTVSAMAIRNSRILAVGESDEILKLAGPTTVRVDLEGKTIIPGIIDTHSHPNSYALSHYSREITPAYLQFLRENGVWHANIRWDNKATALADFKKFSESVPPGEIIIATTYSNDTVRRHLFREDLDQAAPNHPIFIRIGYGIWGVVNSKMLDLLRDMYGEKLLPGVLRNEEGEPTGQLVGAAGEIIDVEVLPQTPVEILAPVFKKELEEWIAIGITTLSTRLKGREISAYAHLDREGQLPLRLPYSHEVGRANPAMERHLKRFGNLEGHGTDRMWLIGVSISNPDGNGPAPPGPGGEYTMARGSSDCASVPKREILPNDVFPEGACMWDWPEDPGYESSIIANRYGYRVVGVHNFGDRASLMNLDAYAEANQESSILKRKFALDHGMMVSPDVIQRSKELGVMWSLQPPIYYARYAAGVSRIYGEEYAHRWMLPAKSLINAGIKVAWGADTHNDPERHPMFNMEILVTRKISDGRVFGPQEAIGRDQVLLMMTRWGAEYVLREKELGSLEPGKLADLLILDNNPLNPKIPDEDLSEIKVLTTLIGGKVVYGSFPGQSVQ